jgi:ethanolamine utilization protein EutN
MKLGIVIGTVVATRKTANMKGQKILLVHVLTEEMDRTETTLACTDTVGAGEGNVVLLCGSSSARMTARTKGVATDMSIVGIVDSITTPDRARRSGMPAGGI